MTYSRRIAAGLTGLILLASPVFAAPPATWDGLVQVRSTRLDLVYVQPGADFRGYSKVIIEPTEVAFQKNWRRDYNRSASDLSSQISEKEEQRAISKGVEAAHDIFTKAWTGGGYQVTNTPGPDVLRVKTGVVNISVNAPDTRSAGRSRTYADEAGEATLFVEVRDSSTGALLGRAVDQRIIGDNSSGRRTSVSNRGDFRDMVTRWARTTVNGMAELRKLAPTAR